MVDKFLDSVVNIIAVDLSSKLRTSAMDNNLEKDPICFYSNVEDPPYAQIEELQYALDHLLEAKKSLTRLGYYSKDSNGPKTTNNETES